MAKTALTPFFEAATPELRKASIPSVLERSEDVEALLAGLRSGPDLPAHPPTGRVEGSIAGADRTFPWFALVPRTYDPSRRYPVRFYLHGGVARAEPDPSGTWWEAPEQVAGEDHIAVFPAAWRGAPWWTAIQVDNLHAILDRLKQRYRVDENRVSVTGVSDGGTGVYFLAFRDVTPWSAFLPFIGHAGVLLNPAVGADGPFSLMNVSNRPFYIVNSEDDRLYPVRMVQPMVDAFREVGAEVVWRPQAGGGHDTRWWPAETAAIDRFLAAHPRDPHPSRITWETDRTDRYARAHWLVIEELGHVPGEAAYADVVVLEDPGDAGRVVAERAGNTVTLDTRGVTRLRLLLSPDVFDLSRPVRVVVNGAQVHHGVVRQDPQTLLEWAAVDYDRTLLYTASLTVDLTSRP